MGGKGGGSDGSDKMIEEQRRQAEEARKKEEERKARVQQGMTSIKQAFEGAPVMGTKQAAFDWNGLSAPTVNPALLRSAWAGTDAAKGAVGSALPAGFEWIQTTAPVTAAPAAGAGIRGINPQGTGNVQRGWMNQNQYIGGDSGKDAPRMGTGATTRAGGAAPAGGGQVWAIKGPDGKIHYQGQGFNYDTSYDTGKKTGGFDDSFYNDYKTGIVDYYQPQVADQYDDAKKELTYRLARAGILRSTMASDETADLSSQYDLNTANVLNKADQGAADLRSQVASERAKAESQLLASEDPNAAASQALAAVRDISLEKPNLSPLSALFNIAAIGTAGAARGYQNAKAANAHQQVGRNSSKNIGM